MSNPFFNFKTLQKGSNKMVQIIKECYSKTDTLVSPNIQPGFLRSQLPIYPPQQGQDLDSIIDQTKKIFHPGVFQWHSQKFFGYYPCITSVVSVIAEMYTTAFHSPNFCYAVGPSFTELENHVVDWSCIALGLPERFLLKSLGGGTINNSTSQSIFSTIHTAKRKKMKQLGIQGNDPRVLKFVGYYGQTAHTSSEKGLSVKDIYYRRSVPYFYNREKLNYFMDQQKLLSMIEQDVKNGLIPFWIGCSYGNTFSAAIDISDRVVSICKKFGMWINVDAAYLGSTWISQKYRPQQKWPEEVDSICINFSKILLNGSGGSLLFIADKKNLMQSFSDDTSNFTFYQNKFNQNYDVTDYKDWSVGLGRRNNSLKLYYTFKHYGIKFIKEAVEKQDQKLHFLHNLIRKHQDLFDVHAIQYSLILFQAKLKNGQNSQKLTRQIGQQIQNISQGFCTPSQSKGLYMLRINICNFHTEQEHILTYFNQIVKISSQLQAKAQSISP